MNSARNIDHWRKVWRNALTAHGVDVSAVPDSAVAVWPLSVGKPAVYALALTSRQASPDTAAGLWVTLSAWNQIADLLAILGAMEWKISHGPILDMYGAATICGHKAAGAAAINVTSGWWPGADRGDPLPDGWDPVWSMRVKPNKPRADRPYVTGPALGQGNSVRSESGRGRIMYDPCWNESAPWVSFYNGTAGRCFQSLADAGRHFRDHYRDPLVLPDLAAAYRP